MNQDKTLLILAAGMGSRFGGLKQIEPMGPNGEFIIDYSIYDAIKAGFNKVVFLIKEENYELFKETVGRRVEQYIHVEYAFQKNDNVSDEYPILKNRDKPLGTAHAILCCKEKINESFAIINADDFYGRDAFIKAIQFLTKAGSTDKENYGMIGYIIHNTIIDTGSVKRGVCEVENGYLKKITESKVQKQNGEIIAEPLDGSIAFSVPRDSVVSMNFLLFNPSIFEYIEKKFPVFLEQNKESLDAEFLIPNILFEAIQEGFATVEVIQTSAQWHGVTYREDVIDVKESILHLIHQGEYDEKLWKSKVKE